MAGVSDRVQAELVTLNAVDTVEGQIALALAEQLDNPRNGMAVSGDARELRAVMQEIRGKIPAKADPVDELNARRSSRGAAPKAG